MKSSKIKRFVDKSSEVPGAIIIIIASVISCTAGFTCPDKKIADDTQI